MKNLSNNNNDKISPNLSNNNKISPNLIHKRYYSISRSPRNSRSPIFSKSNEIRKLSLRNYRSLREDSRSSDSSSIRKWSIRKFFNKKSKDDSSESEEIIDNTHNQTMCEMRILLSRKKSELDTIENVCNNEVRKKKHYSMGIDNVNDVFHVYDEKRNFAGYYKSGRNGNVKSGYMENGIYEISVQFSVEKYFASTKIKSISPRTQKQLNIVGKKNRLSLVEYSENSPLEISFQKKVEGTELRYIKSEQNMTLLQAFSKYYPSLRSYKIKPIFEKYFIKATIVSIMFGFWDGHSKNIILNRDGFRFFDNARSLPHSNNLIAWGDKLRLPYFTDFLKEDFMFNILTKNNMDTCVKMATKFLTGFKYFKYYLNSTMGKKLIKKVSGEWFSKKLIIETYKERIDGLVKWATKQKSNKTLFDLVCHIFPFYLFSVMLKVIQTINDDTKTPYELWKSAIETIGRHDDMLYLIDCCVENNVDPYQILEVCNEENFSYEEIINNIIKGEYKIKTLGNGKLVKLEMYNDFSFDFKECADIPNWVVSFLNQYTYTDNINLFDQNNLFLPDDALELGFLASIEKSLFSKGYFLTFYAEESDVYCSVCSIDTNGFIRMHEIKVLFDGKIRFQLSKKNHLNSLYDFSKWLDRFNGRDFNIKEKLKSFITQYSDYYKQIYLCKIFTYLNISYIDTDKYETIPENIKIMKEYELKHLHADGTFVYIYSSEQDMFGIFEFKYMCEKEIVKTLIDLDNEGNIIIENIGVFTLEEFGIWVKNIND